MAWVQAGVADIQVTANVDAHADAGIDAEAEVDADGSAGAEEVCNPRCSGHSLLNRRPPWAYGRQRAHHPTLAVLEPCEGQMLVQSSVVEFDFEQARRRPAQLSGHVEHRRSCPKVS